MAVSFGDLASMSSERMTALLHAKALKAFDSALGKHTKDTYGPDVELLFTSLDTSSI
jgi:hypothetical protein